MFSFGCLKQKLLVASVPDSLLLPCPLLPRQHAHPAPIVGPRPATRHTPVLLGVVVVSVLRRPAVPGARAVEIVSVLTAYSLHRSKVHITVVANLENFVLCVIFTVVKKLIFGVLCYCTMG